MKSSLFSVFAASLFCLASSCFAGDAIPLIGLDKSGSEVAVGISEEDYSRQLTTVFSTVQDSTLAAVSQHPSTKAWMLRQVIIGAGLQVDATLGPIVAFSAKPRVRLIFANTSNLFFP